MKVLMYHHGSSYNHGCEAILRTVSGIISEQYPDAAYVVSSFRPHEDLENIDCENGRFTFIESDKLIGLSYERRKLLVGSPSRLFHNIPFFRFLFKKTVDAAKEADVIISVGGDTYSYGKSSELTTIDNKMRKLCNKSVLWGCSIDEKFLVGDKYKHKVKGLRNFSLITARESITYESLKKLGFDNVKLFPDPAFTLKSKAPEEAMFENDRDIIGINLSPLILGYESSKDQTLKCYVELVKKILDTTDFNVALISHVKCKTSNDTNTSKKIIENFKDCDRIRIFDKGNAEEIKGMIGKCRFFVAARTHASIAAYSQMIPTLVVGYSVKSTGIAKDIFGTDKGYVIPVGELKSDSALAELFFENIVEKEDEIKEIYKKVMPDYIARAHLAGEEFARLFNVSGKETK